MVVIAIVAVIATAGLATAILGGATAAASASTAATIAAYAVAGLVVGAVASVVQQGLFIALGYQKGFSWKEVAAGAVAGALGGAAQGVGAAAKIAATAGKLTETTATYMKVTEGALSAASSASKELIENGKITSWVGLAAAAVGGYASATKAIGQGELALATKEAGEEGITGITSAETAAKGVIGTANTITKVTNYVTPWAQLAESAARGQKLTPEDWASAVGSTLNQAAVDNFGAQGKDAQTFSGLLLNGALRLGTDALVAGALSAYSPQQAQDYFDNSVGHETGQFIGGLLTNPVSKLFSFTSSPARQPNAGAGSSASTTSQQSGPATLSAATTAGPQSTGQGNGITADQADGILVDANGNPIAIEPSLEQIQLNPQLVQLPAISVTAQPGDSISTLLGTSDPVAIEAFMRANGLSDSTIIAGELYAAKRE